MLLRKQYETKLVSFMIVLRRHRRLILMFFRHRIILASLPTYDGIPVLLRLRRHVLATFIVVHLRSRASFALSGACESFARVHRILRRKTLSLNNVGRTSSLHYYYLAFIVLTYLSTFYSSKY
jgi:hypothetical protein